MGTLHYSFLKQFLRGISPHLVRSGDISLIVCIREPRVCDVISIGRERTLGMSVCVPSSWPVSGQSGVVIWRIISTCFLGLINLQGKGKSSSLLTFFIVLSKLCWL